MSRRLLWPFFVVVFIAAVPRAADAQDCRSFSHAFSCGHQPAAPWAGLSFGAPRFWSEPPATITWRSGRWAPVPEWAPVLPHRGAHGDIVHIPLGVMSGVPPIDCAMTRPGNLTLDPKVVRAPAPLRGHSGVIIPVAPCRWK